MFEIPWFGESACLVVWTSLRCSIVTDFHDDFFCLEAYANPYSRVKDGR
jgi:hypothetical protein